MATGTETTSVEQTLILVLLPQVTPQKAEFWDVQTLTVMDGRIQLMHSQQTILNSLTKMVMVTETIRQEPMLMIAH